MTPRRSLEVSIGLNLVLTIGEAIVGFLTGSLGLVSDAVHNLSDVFALAIAYLSSRLAARGPSASFTFGLVGAETVAAAANGAWLVVLGVVLVIEGTGRILSPEPIEGLWMLVAAGTALIVNLLSASLVKTHSHGNLNFKAALFHLLADALTSFAVAVGGLAIMFWGVYWVDGAVTVLAAGFCFFGGLRTLRRSLRMLLKGVPPGLSLEDVRSRLLQEPDVSDIHHIHIWQLSEKRKFFEGHVVVVSSNLFEAGKVKASLKTILREEFDVTHSTLEIESAEDPLRCSSDQTKGIGILGKK